MTTPPRSTSPLTKLSTWDDTIRRLPYAHLLQTEEWGEFKRRSTGWTPEKILLRDSWEHVVGAALVLTRRIGPLAVMYVPKGPMLDYYDPLLLKQMLERLETLARRRLAIWLKIDPDVIEGTGAPGTPVPSIRSGSSLSQIASRRRANASSCSSICLSSSGS